MNLMHVAGLAVLVVFLVLFLQNPRNPRAALTFMRYALLVTAGLLFLSPFLWLICSAFKNKEVAYDYTFLPPARTWLHGGLTLANFTELFKPSIVAGGRIYFWQYLFNSLLLASAATLIQLFFASLCGFALAKYRFPGRNATLSFMLGSMMLPGMLLMAPNYKMIVDIGWVDSYLALLVPGAVNVFGVILFRQSMLSLPNEILESARMDGCGEFGIYWHIVMPLMRPVSAALCLTTFLGSWNNYLAVSVYIHSQTRLTLPVVMNLFMSQYSTKTDVYMAGTLLALIPPAILFFALQKEFVSGLTAGAVKS